MAKKETPPNKDKEFLDDLGSPATDKGEDLDEEKIKGKETAESSEAEQEEAGELGPKVQELLKKKGFKNLDELADSYSSLESQTTRLSQERKLKFIPPGPEFQTGIAGAERKNQPFKATLPKGIYEKITDDEAALGVFDSFGNQVLERAKADLREEYGEEKKREVQVAVGVKRAQDPETFDRLVPRMKFLADKYPHATLDQIYAQADEDEKADRTRIESESETKFRKLIREEINKIANPVNISESGGEEGGKPRMKEKKTEVETFMEEVKKANILRD
jgi:hypothetical protein